MVYHKCDLAIFMLSVHTPILLEQELTEQIILFKAGYVSC